MCKGARTSLGSQSHLGGSVSANNGSNMDMEKTSSIETKIQMGEVIHFGNYQTF